MKKLIFYISVIFFSASLFTSCTTDEGDNPDRLTARGKTMTDEWVEAMNFILDCYADVPFRLNYYIENELGSQNTNDNVWDVIVNENVAHTINTYGQPLDSIGAKWELTSLADYTSLGLRQDDFSVNFSITCIDTNSWNICSINEDFPEYFFNVNITCKDTPKRLVDYTYKLSGEGNLCLSPYGYYYEYIHGDYHYDFKTSNHSNGTRYKPHFSTLAEGINIHFETEDDLQKLPWYDWIRGSVNITARNKEGQTSSTRAAFYRKSSEYIVEITYGGVTEEWHGYYFHY